MTLKTTKRLLTLATLLILSAAVGILAWGFAPAAEIEPTEGLGPSLVSADKATKRATRNPSKAVTTDLVASSIDAANLAAFWERPLRRPLFDPPPPPPKPIEKKVLPPIRARLLATMIEAENSTAVLKLASGEVVFRKVGQPLGTDEPNAKIARIEPGSVSVSRDGDETRLMVDGQKGK